MCYLGEEHSRQGEQQVQRPCGEGTRLVGLRNSRRGGQSGRRWCCRKSRADGVGPGSHGEDSVTLSEIGAIGWL